MRQYDIDEDEKALKIYEAVGFNVIPIAARTIMKEKGSLHCITNSYILIFDLGSIAKTTGFFYKTLIKRR